MTAMLAAVGAWPALVAALVVWGIAPGFVLRLVTLAFRKDDPRRQEMIAELYTVPRWDRPFWVGEQMERAFTEGLWERLVDAADGRLFNRWHLTDGVEWNKKHPDTFWVPDETEKSSIKPGDFVKLMFEGHPDGGERMWVEVTSVNGEMLRGTLANQPVIVGGVNYGSQLRFHASNVIDIDRPSDGHDCVCGTDCSCSDIDTQSHLN